MKKNILKIIFVFLSSLYSLFGIHLLKMPLSISEEEYGGNYYDSDWMHYILYTSLFILTIRFPLFLCYSHCSKYTK